MKSIRSVGGTTRLFIGTGGSSGLFLSNFLFIFWHLGHILTWRRYYGQDVIKRNGIVVHTITFMQSI